MYNFKKIKIFSIILLICIILTNISSPIFAVNLKSIEGLILYNNEKIQLLSIEGKIYDTNPEMEEDVREFCKIIGNSGMKVKATIEDNKEEQIKLLGISTAVELTGQRKEEWEEYIKSKYGTYSELEGVITKNNDIFSFVTKDDIFTPISFEYEAVEKYAEIIANKGIKIKIESAVYNDKSILISYVEPVESLPDEELKAWQDFQDETLERYTKYGVIISYGSDTYMLVENNTNKMYYLTTSDEQVYLYVPAIADRGIQTALVVNETSDNTLDVLALDTRKMDEDVTKELEDIYKKHFESTLFSVEGYILKEGEDYNIYFNNETEQIGLESAIPDVVKVVTAVANDKSVKLKFEGYINVEQTVMDVRTVTFLVDITEGETLKKLQEAFPEQNVTKTTTNTTVAGSTDKTTDNTTNNTANTTTNTTGAGLFNNSTFDELYNSMFGNSNNITSNFSSLLGENSSIYDNYNAFSQAQSDMLNSSNLSNFNFEEFQSSFNALSASMTTE